MSIESYIPKGYHNRVTRAELVFRTGKRDRIIRDAISEAVENGALIASADGGYFRWLDKNDDPYFVPYMMAEERRERTQRKRNRARRRAWEGVHPDAHHDRNEIPGQMSFEF